MSAPVPYQPLQYPEEPTLIYAGQQTLGNTHKFQVDSSNPTQFASGKNADASDFWFGEVIARQGSDFVSATSGNAASLAIGLATLGAPKGQPEMVQLYGLITIEDWTRTTGAASLIPGANYYLQNVRGTLSTAPNGAFTQLVGIATTAKTMEIVAGGAMGSALAPGGSNTIGMSNLGITAGTTGVVSGSAVQFLFAGGNNVTLSQSLDGVSGTITIQGAAGSAIAGVQTFGMSNLGHTSGTTGVVTGSAIEFILVGGNNITLSQSINANAGTITISAFNAFDMTLAGNTSGALALISSGTLTLAGGNSITLSQVGNAVTISGAAITVIEPVLLMGG